jgi:hypothetical protein
VSPSPLFMAACSISQIPENDLASAYDGRVDLKLAVERSWAAAVLSVGEDARYRPRNLLATARKGSDPGAPVVFANHFPLTGHPDRQGTRRVVVRSSILGDVRPILPGTGPSTSPRRPRALVL